MSKKGDRLIHHDDNDFWSQICKNIYFLTNNVNTYNTLEKLIVTYLWKTYLSPSKTYQQNSSWPSFIKFIQS